MDQFQEQELLVNRPITNDTKLEGQLNSILLGLKGIYIYISALAGENLLHFHDHNA